MENDGINESLPLRGQAEQRLNSTKSGSHDLHGRDPLVLIHELLVQKIELEMQNEELHCAQQQLDEARQRYQDLYETAPVGYVTLDEKGTITESNLTAATLLGKERSFLVKRPLARFFSPESSTEFEHFRRRLFAGTDFERCEVMLKTAPDRRAWLLVEGVATAHEDARSRECRAVLSDMTERKRAEEEREATVEFLRITNESRGTEELIHAATAFFQKRSGFEAVGIRLREGEDYSYYETQGFPEEFVLAENRLCACDEAGQPICDSAGNPVIDCMCGNVICERFDPEKPFFSARGSFWTNSTSELLSSTSESDRQARTRNRCHGEGYESVALIPLRLGQERLGLLQFNDRQKGCFSPEAIALWERLADYLAVALAKFRADEEILRRVEELRVTNEELTRFNDASVRRELRMIELKKEINDICCNAGMPPRYPLDFEEV